MGNVPTSVHEALEIILAEQTLYLFGLESESIHHTNTCGLIFDYVVTHGWSEWEDLIQSFPAPSVVLARLRLCSSKHTPQGDQDSPTQDERLTIWLRSNLDAWVANRSYHALLHELPLEEFRHLLGSRTSEQLQALVTTSPTALAYIALALACTPEDENEHPALSTFSRLCGRGDVDVLADHMTETSTLICKAATEDLSKNERLDWQNTLIQLARRYSAFKATDQMQSALEKMLAPETAYKLIGAMDKHEIIKLSTKSRSLFRELSFKVPRDVAAKIFLYWSENDTHSMWDSELRNILDIASPALCEELAPLVTHDMILSDTRQNTHALQARDNLNKWIVSHAPTTEGTLKELWRLISLWAKAARSKDDAARAGHESRLQALVTQHPDLWSRSLPALLAKPTSQQLVLLMTVALGIHHPEIRQRLRDLADSETSDVTARALHLLEVIEGTAESPTDAIFQALVSFVARRADEQTVFPHPLQLPSSTWIGTRGVEETLRSLVIKACDSFALRAVKQLALEEEQITRDLLLILEHTLKDFPASPWIVRDATRRETFKISIDHRQETKRAEAFTGVDFALLVDIDIPGAIKLTTGELLQVKKPERDSDSLVFRENWRIKVPQLLKILEASPTAGYVLISPRGELYVVPAKFILGVLQGRGKVHQETATLSYAQIRGAAIQLTQFFTDLVLGLWIGGTEGVVAIARGTDNQHVPMNVLTIQVRATSLDHDFRG